MKKILPFITLAVTVFVFPALASGQHQSHTAATAMQAAAPPQASQVVIEPAAQSNPTVEIKTGNAMSVPLGAAYENCNRSRQNQTVYLTQ